MKYAKIFLIVLIAGVLLFFFFRDVNLQKVTGIVMSVNIIHPLVFLAGLYLQFFIRAYRWGILLKSHKSPIPMATLYNYTVIGYFLNILIPGRVGEPVRGILLAAEEDINRSYGLASVVLERLIDSLMIVVLFLVSLFFVQSGASPLLAGLKNASYFIFPIILFILLLFYLLNTPRLFGYAERLVHLLCRLLPERFRDRVSEFTLHFLKGLRLDLSFVDYLKLLFSSLLVWIFLIPFYWFLMRGFEFGADIGLFETIPYFSFIVAAAAIPTPGMAGSFDAASRHGLEQLYGVAADPAVAYTLLSHFLILMVIFIPGLTAFWMKGISIDSIRRIKGEEQASDDGVGDGVDGGVVPGVVPATETGE